MRTVSRLHFLAVATCAVVLVAGLQLLAQQVQQPPAFNPNFGEKRNQPDEKAIPDAKPTKLDVKITGPYKHENLTIFLLHGEDKMKNKNFLLLHEAMEQKKVIIHETKQVNDLAVENISDQEVLLLSGDIISGGQQDRVITLDQILPPKSGKQPLAVHCVEKTAPRWMSAYTEKNKVFAGSFDVLNTKDLRLANAAAMSQHAVWEKVEVTQAKLGQSLKFNANVKESTSSLQLSLKSKEVQQAADKYTSKLQDVIKDKKDVIGYAFAINNQIYGVDVYGSNTLFQKVWPRLIRANAIEAAMEDAPQKMFKAVSIAGVEKFMAEGDAGKASGKEIGLGLHRIQCDAKTNYGIQTYCPKANALLRGVYLAK